MSVNMGDLAARVAQMELQQHALQQQIGVLDSRLQATVEVLGVALLTRRSDFATALAQFRKIASTAATSNPAEFQRVLDMLSSELTRSTSYDRRDE